MDQLGREHELHGYELEDLAVGMTAEYCRAVTEEDIAAFAALSGDINPLHLNREFASETIFEGCVAHGLLSASFISTVIGTKLPGPGCVYVSQNLNFRAPVRPGDFVTARATISRIVSDKRRVSLKTVCMVGETVVIDGDAMVMVPSRG